MEDVKRWYSAAWAHLSERWRDHLPPVAIFFAAVLALVFAVFAVLALAGVAGAVSREPLVGVAVAVFLGGPLLLLGAVAIQPLMLGYHRIVLAGLRGGPADLETLWASYRHALPVVLLNVLVQAASMVAMLFCFFPSLIVTFACIFALWAMADRPIGPLAALRVSFDIVRRRPGEVALALVGGWVGLLILSYIPLVGPIAGMMGWMTVLGVMYEELSADVPESLWEGVSRW